MQFICNVKGGSYVTVLLLHSSMSTFCGCRISVKGRKTLVITCIFKQVVVSFYRLVQTLSLSEVHLKMLYFEKVAVWT